MAEGVATKKVAAVAALATGASKPEAAEVAGVHRSTIYRWLGDPDFAGDVVEARSSLLDRLLDLALEDAFEAREVLRVLMAQAQGADGEATRLRAAQTLYRTAMDGIRARLMPESREPVADLEGPVVLDWPDWSE